MHRDPPFQLLSFLSFSCPSPCSSCHRQICSSGRYTARIVNHFTQHKHSLLYTHRARHFATTSTDETTAERRTLSRRKKYTAIPFPSTVAATATHNTTDHEKTDESSTDPPSNTVFQSSRQDRRRKRVEVDEDKDTAENPVEEKTHAKTRRSRKSEKTTNRSSSDTTGTESSSSSLVSLGRRSRIARAALVPAFPFRAAPTFGIQTVMKLLYTYLPPPSTAAPSASSSSFFPSSSSPFPAHPVSVFDVSTRSIFHDYVILVFTHSVRQMRFLAHAVYKQALTLNACEANPRTLSMERRKSDDWILVDTGHIMVHMFNTQAKIQQPGLDYLPQLYMEMDTEEVEEVVNGDSPAASSPAASPSPGLPRYLPRHPVIDSILNHFADTLIPIHQHSSLTDYPHGPNTGREPIEVQSSPAAANTYNAQHHSTPIH